MTDDGAQPLGEVLEVVIEAAREAGALIRAELFRAAGPRGPLGTCPVDVDAEVAIRSRLRARFPTWQFFGEETGLTGETSEYRWLVDPNDGTRAFQRGHRGSAVSIALLRGAELVLGVVFAPCPPIGTEDLIVWAEGCGPVTRNGVAVVRDWPDALSSDSVVLVSQDADAKRAVNAAVTAPARFLPTPSVAYRLALVGAGEGDAAISMADAQDYDFAAGHAILKAAGGVVLDGSGASIAYGRHGGERTKSGGFLVGGGPQVAATLAARPWQRIRSADKDLGPFVRPDPAAAVEDPVLDRVQGVLLGQLIGDALGAQVEFEPAVRIATRFPTGVRDINDGGPFNTLAGQPTDDSEMALALARSLVREGRYSATAVAAAYVDWYESEPFDIGTTTTVACSAGAYAKGEGLDVVEAMRAAASQSSQANGALMRVSPLAVFAHRDVEAAISWAIDDARLTHPHPVCRAANAAYVAAIVEGVRGANRPEQMASSAREAVRSMPGGEAVIDAIRAGERSPPENMDSVHIGWVLHALRNAFFELHHAATFEDALVATVGRGGDTDTNGAICGALLGALHGATGMPARWIRRVLTCQPGPSSVQPRPPRFWPVDALILAGRLAGRGHG